MDGPGVSQPLPPEVLSKVLADCDFEDLLSFGAASRAFRKLALPAIYGEVDLHTEEVAKAGFETLSLAALSVTVDAQIVIEIRGLTSPDDFKWRGAVLNSAKRIRDIRLQIYEDAQEDEDDDEDANGSDPTPDQIYWTISFLQDLPSCRLSLEYEGRTGSQTSGLNQILEGLQGRNLNSLKLSNITLDSQINQNAFVHIFNDLRIQKYIIDDTVSIGPAASRLLAPLYFTYQPEDVVTEEEVGRAASRVAALAHPLKAWSRRLRSLRFGISTTRALRSDMAIHPLNILAGLSFDNLESLELSGMHVGNALLLHKVRAPQLSTLTIAADASSLLTILSAVTQGFAPQLSSLDLDLDNTTEVADILTLLATLKILELDSAKRGIRVAYRLPPMQPHVLAHASFPLASQRHASIALDETAGIPTAFHAVTINPAALEGVTYIEFDKRRTAYSSSSPFIVTHLLMHLHLRNLLHLQTAMSFSAIDMCNLRDIILSRRMPILERLSGQLRWKMDREAIIAWNALLDACIECGIETDDFWRIHGRSSTSEPKQGKVTPAEMPAA